MERDKGKMFRQQYLRAGKVELAMERGRDGKRMARKRESTDQVDSPDRLLAKRWITLRKMGRNRRHTRKIAHCGREAILITSPH